LILFLVTLFLLTRSFALKKEVKKISKQLQSYNNRKTNKKVDIALLDKDIENLGLEINKLNDLYMNENRERNKLRNEKQKKNTKEKKKNIKIQNNKKLKTNKKVDIALLDKDIENLELEINKLIDLYVTENRERVQFQHEQQQAIANMSHDLRTPLTSILGY